MKQLLINLANTIDKNLILNLVTNEIDIIEDGSECKKVTLKSKRKQIFAFSLDKNFYLYSKSRQEQIQAGYTPFAQPVNVYTNVKNGFGVFGSYSIYTDSLIVEL